MGAIVFVTMLAGRPETAGTFDGVSEAAYFLFIASITGIDKNFIAKMATLGWFFWGLWLFYLLVANMTIFKMMTGVLVRVADAQRKATNDHVSQEALHSKLRTKLSRLDRDHTGTVEKAEFE